MPCAHEYVLALDTSAFESPADTILKGIARTAAVDFLTGGCWLQATSDDNIRVINRWPIRLWRFLITSP
jgi:hypothetical protein